MLLASIASLALFVSSSAEELPLGEVSHIHGIGFDASKPGSVLLATHYGVYRANPYGMAETVSTDAKTIWGLAPIPAMPDGCWPAVTLDRAAIWG